MPEKQTTPPRKNKKQRVTWHIYLVLYLLIGTLVLQFYDIASTQVIALLDMRFSLSDMYCSDHTWPHYFLCSEGICQPVALMRKSISYLVAIFFTMAASFDKQKQAKEGKVNAEDQFPTIVRNGLPTHTRVVPNTILGSVRYQHIKFHLKSQIKTL